MFEIHLNIDKQMANFYYDFHFYNWKLFLKTVS